MMGTKTKYVLMKIVIDAEDETLCGQWSCPHFRQDEVAGLTAKNCRLYFRGLHPGPMVKRCDECLGSVDGAADQGSPLILDRCRKEL